VRNNSFFLLGLGLTLVSAAGVGIAQEAAGRTTASGYGNPGALDEIVVTAERRAEPLQDVPIAVTALSGDALKNQRIDSGANLVQAVPNMTFQPGLYGKPDFVIRGVGYQLVTSTGESGVAIHVNEAPVSLSRIAQEDFFDVERVEVLRGPQGTLYGRNATGGVVNVITNKPTDSFAAGLTAEGGNFSTYKATGFVNVPLIDQTLALRVAGYFDKHDGYQTNEFDGHSIGFGNVWATRVTLTFQPSDRLHARVMWEHYDENDGGDQGGGNTRSICLHDPGPTAVGTTSLIDANPRSPFIRAFESLGCAPSSIYNPGVLTGAPNGIGIFGNRLGLAIGLAPGDLYANNVLPSSRYGVDYDEDQSNKSKDELAQVELQFKVTDELNLIALGNYTEDHVRAGGGLGGLRADIPFSNDITVASPQIQNGAPLAYWTQGLYNDLKTQEWSSELRLVSAFTGPLNFSIGGIYDHIARRDNIFIFDNLDAYFGTHFEGLPLDPNPATAADGGHYYYQSLNPYRLQSKAAFGELYWSLTDTVRVTAGLRYTDDKKIFDNNNSASNLLNPVPPVGYSFFAPQVAEFKEPTGRLNVDWSPKLSFTDATLLYASFSRGYKGGGFNPPNLVPQGTYAPEFVNAFEIGMKNELLDHRLRLNMSGFFYDYKGYQFTQAAVYGTVTSNVDAHIFGTELETAWEPIRKLAVNAQIGYLNTKIQAGANAFSIDQYNPTGGNPNFTFMKSLNGGCIVNTANFAHLLSDIKNGVNTAGGATVAGVADLLNLGFPGTANLCAGSFPEYNLFAGVPGGVGAGGVPLSIAGNRLPNVPAVTVALGAQYTFDLSSSWTLTPRLDWHHQGDIYTDLFNDRDNRVKAYDIENATLTLAQSNEKLSLQAYVKNLTNSDAIIGAAQGGGAILGNPRSITVADPRTYGLSIRARF
jgi:outer membrane receptor protein involved in Fe transport